MYAAIGTGIFKNTAEAISGLVREEKIFEPNIQNHEIYINEFERWRTLYRLGLDLVEQGLARSMWQSGGTMSKAQIENPWKL
jgi:autoinducer 2 (AI-2) kinase